MYLENVSKLDEECLLSDDLFIELFSLSDEIEKARAINDLEDRASRLKCLSKFKRLLSTYTKQFKKEDEKSLQKVEGCKSYMMDIAEKGISLRSGSWQIDDGGIFTLTDYGKSYACYHPIVPTGILRNAETGTCKSTLVFKVRGNWNEISVGRELLASSNKIISLAQYGVQVTSENSRALVRYISDIEALNSDSIKEHTSTSRLGWIGNSFMPYSTNEIVFDNDPKLLSLFRSIREEGDREKWFDNAREVRQEGHIEVLIYMAASLASVLVEPCGALPFIVSLWGGTGKGKTVALMLATSIWADPSEGAYMTDAKATATAMEIRLDALNSMPMTLDDMAQIKNQDDDFSALVYRWCAGKGRDRSNQSLGLNPMTNWRNCTLTNGERSLVTDLMQGGAVNRIIDVEISEEMFKNGNKESKFLRKNFGFCGKEFVHLVQELGTEAINKIFEKWVDELKRVAKKKGSEKEDKQITPMALILTADELSEKYLYQDGVRLDVEKCCDYLKDKGSVSEHKRAFEYIRDMVASHPSQFEPDDETGVYRFGCWGRWMEVDQGYIAIIPSEFNRIMKEGGFQSKAFLSWADREGLTKREASCCKFPKIDMCGQRIRCVQLNIQADLDENEDFTKVSPEIMETLPF